MLNRLLEPEVMDSAEEARDYDAMDHSVVNDIFVRDLLSLPVSLESVLDVGTGTAQIPVVLCRLSTSARVVAIDMARHMLALARHNIESAGFLERIQVEACDAKAMPYADALFSAVISNSIIHHIPEPRAVLHEMHRVLAPGGWLFVRDLLRPHDTVELDRLVTCYAGEASPHQQQMFRESLHAALTLPEIRALVAEVGCAPSCVEQTSDRHWTWKALKPG